MGAGALYNGNISIPEAPVLDSNLRFFSGLGLGVGLMLVWITPTIEKRTLLFRSLWLCALLGGIWRIISMVVVGFPPVPMIIFTIIEVPPISIFWQWSVSKNYPIHDNSQFWPP